MVEERGYALQLTDIHKSFFKNEVLKGITLASKRERYWDCSVPMVPVNPH